MPPKPKFTREEIVAAALDIVRERGLKGLTARDLGARLGASARPIFTVFENMEDLTREVYAAATARMGAYADRASKYAPESKRMGMQMAIFAREEPKLFQLLLMRENENITCSDVLFENLGPDSAKCVQAMQQYYDLDVDSARALFEQVWIFTYGVSALCATGMCRFSDDELSEMLTREFTGALAQIRAAIKPSGGNQNAADH